MYSTQSSWYKSSAGSSGYCDMIGRTQYISYHHHHQLYNLMQLKINPEINKKNEILFSDLIYTYNGSKIYTIEFKE